MEGLPSKRTAFRPRAPGSENARVPLPVEIRVMPVKELSGLVSWSVPEAFSSIPDPARPVMRAARVIVTPEAGLILAKSVVEVPLREKVRLPSPLMVRSALAVRTSPPLFEKASVAPGATVTDEGALTVRVLSVMLAGILTATGSLIVAVSPAACGMPADQLAAVFQLPVEPPTHVESNARALVDISRQAAENRDARQEDVFFIINLHLFYYYCKREL